MMAEIKSVGPSLPSNVEAYKRTLEFTADTLPAGLKADHATKAGVWGVITVLEGELRYAVPDANVDVVLDASTRGIIAPQQVHRVEASGTVRFYVEFYR